jgi:hypothetical protein
MAIAARYTTGTSLPWAFISPAALTIRSFLFGAPSFCKMNCSFI